MARSRYFKKGQLQTFGRPNLQTIVKKRNAMSYFAIAIKLTNKVKRATIFDFSKIAKWEIETKELWFPKVTSDWQTKKELHRGGKSPVGRQRAMSASANGGVMAQGQRRQSSGNANNRSISEGKKMKIRSFATKKSFDQFMMHSLSNLVLGL